MPCKLGISHYLGEEGTELLNGNGRFAFVSAHIPEKPTNSSLFASLVTRLKNQGFSVICDIDARTAPAWGFQTEETFLAAFNIDFLRLDAGYSHDDFLSFAKRIPVAFNASTLTEAQKIEILQINPKAISIPHAPTTIYEPQ